MLKIIRSATWNRLNERISNLEEKVRDLESESVIQVQKRPNKIGMQIAPRDYFVPISIKEILWLLLKHLNLGVKIPSGYTEIIKLKK